jgi:hypothetical protein
MVNVLPLIVTRSVYVPAATVIVSPEAAASIAAWIVAKQPLAPPGATHKVAATALELGDSAAGALGASAASASTTRTTPSASRPARCLAAMHRISSPSPS